MQLTVTTTEPKVIDSNPLARAARKRGPFVSGTPEQALRSPERSGRARFSSRRLSAGTRSCAQGGSYSQASRDRQARELVAVIRGSDGGRRMYGIGDHLPKAYTERFRTQIYNERVAHPGAWN